MVRGVDSQSTETDQTRDWNRFVVHLGSLFFLMPVHRNRNFLEPRFWRDFFFFGVLNTFFFWVWYWHANFLDRKIETQKKGSEKEPVRCTGSVFPKATVHQFVVLNRFQSLDQTTKSVKIVIH